MNRFLLVAALTLVATGCAPKRPLIAPECRECRTLEKKIASKAGEKKVRGETLQMALTSAAFYRQRRFATAWSENGAPFPRADSLLRELQGADLEGLNPSEYHVRTIETMRRRWPATPTTEFLAEFDLLLTDGYLLYASHLAGGRTDIDAARAQWKIIRRKVDLVDLLESAIESNEITESLRALLPPHEGYARLRAKLAEYRAIARAGGWPVVPAGDIPVLRQRLAIENGDPAESSGTAKLDTAIQKKIRTFQRTHGLAADGRPGPETLAAMNVPVEDRINGIKFSMDRWRWLPFDLGRRHIIVNIPEFRLYAREEGRAPLGMPIIVGKKDDETATPEFSNALTYLEFSPEWNVPHRIATQEMFPTLQREATSYLKRNHFEVLARKGESWEPVDPATIYWSSMSTTTAGGFPYRIRQRPGPWNALGPVKFMFPNEFAVYIHGNADEGLFDRRLRMFSHGCVRVDDPTKLARWVMNDPDWTVARIRQYMGQSEPVIVPLGEPVAVYLVYWTAWVDGDGRANFREDIYDRDRQMRARFYPESSAQTPPSNP